MADQNNNYPWMEGNLQLLDMLLRNPEELLRVLASGQFRPQSMIGQQTFMPVNQAGSPGIANRTQSMMGGKVNMPPNEAGDGVRPQIHGYDNALNDMLSGVLDMIAKNPNQQPLPQGMGEIPANSLPQTQNTSNQFSVVGDPRVAILNLLQNGGLPFSPQATEPMQPYNQYDPNTEAYIQAEAAKLDNAPMNLNNVDVTPPAPQDLTGLISHAQSITGSMAGITPGVPMGLQIDPFNIHPEEVLANFLSNQSPEYRQIYQQNIQNQQKKDEAARLQNESNQRIAESQAGVTAQQAKTKLEERQQTEVEKQNALAVQAQKEKNYQDLFIKFGEKLPPGLAAQVAAEASQNGTLSPETSKEASKFLSTADILRYRAELAFKPPTLQPGETPYDNSAIFDQLAQDTAASYGVKEKKENKKAPVDLGPIQKVIDEASGADRKTKETAGYHLGQAFRNSPWLKDLLGNILSGGTSNFLVPATRGIADTFKGAFPSENAPVNPVAIKHVTDQLIPMIQTQKITVKDAVDTINATHDLTPAEKIAALKVLQKLLSQ